MRRLLLVAFLFVCQVSADTPHYSNIEAAPHFYSKRPLHDPFSQFATDLEKGRIQLDQSSEKAFLASLLKALNVPVESQVLVFSTTSLQLSLISPSNPRALYFNEQISLGYIPGGKIEIISLDPELGGIFYIFPVPRPGERIQAERSTRCMNCHTSADSRYIPGLVLESVVPGPGGGSLDAFRREDSGHHIPYDQRFGGWYLTGQGSFTNHWGNLIGRMKEGEITKQMLSPGQRFDFGKYPAASSDLLAHLILEHQAGFVNRVIEATYRTRSLHYLSSGTLDSAQQTELDLQARELVRYILFADEPPLPSPVQGDAAFKAQFLATRRTASNGRSLKDFDLQTRLFAHRCSYMIYSPIFAALPSEMKSRFVRELNLALSDDGVSHLLPDEKRTIRTILQETISFRSEDRQ